MGAGLVYSVSLSFRILHLRATIGADAAATAATAAATTAVVRGAAVVRATAVVRADAEGLFHRGLGARGTRDKG